MLTSPPLPHRSLLNRFQTRSLAKSAVLLKSTWTLIVHKIPLFASRWSALEVAMMSAPSSIATATLDAFVGRLEQLECRLIRTPAGLDDASEGEGANAKRTTTIIEQLAKLQKSMHGLAVNSDGRKQLLLLRKKSGTRLSWIPRQLTYENREQTQRPHQTERAARGRHTGDHRTTSRSHEISTSVQVYGFASGNHTGPDDTSHRAPLCAHQSGSQAGRTGSSTVRSGARSGRPSRTDYTVA